MTKKTKGFLTTLLFGLVLLAFTGLTPVAAAQENGNATLTVVVPALNVRSGPGGHYPPTTFVLQGEQATIIGQDGANGWYQVQFIEGTVGWVTNNESYVSVSGDVAASQTVPVDNSPSAALTPNSQSGTLVFQTEAGGAIYAVNPDGTNLHYLTSGMDPTISPDGQTVAFTRWETSQDGALGNVWLVNIDSTNERVIHEYVFNPRTPVWSADGSQLIIAMQHGGQVGEFKTCGTQRPPRNAYNVFIEHNDKGQIEFCYTLPPDPHWGLRQIDLASGTHKDLSAAGDNYSLSPAWDPLYSGHMVYDGDYGLMNLDLYDKRNWVFTEDYNDHSPVYSPDGTKIAVSYRQDNHYEVHVMNADGSNRQRLTQTSYVDLVEQQLRGEQPYSHNNAAPAWSPNGSQIAFVTDRSGAFEIWLMNADGSNQHPLLIADVLAQNGIKLQYSGVDEKMLSWR